MRDESPIALRRLLALRQFDMFDGAELADLAIVGDNVVERTFAAGATVAEPATRVPSLHLVLDGLIETHVHHGKGTGALMRWGPREAFGGTEVLARRPLTSPAIAVVDTRTLELGASDLREILDDSFGLMTALIRDVAARIALIERDSTPVPAIAMASAPGPLGLVDRIIALRQLRPFESVRLDALASLAHGAEEMEWPGGQMLARAGELARAAFIILQGPPAMPAGSAFGLLETLGSLPQAATVTTPGPVRALRLSGSTIFDVIEDHMDDGMAILEALAGVLVDAVSAEPRPRRPSAN